MKIIVLEGGIGRCLFFSALIPKLAEEDGKIMTMSSYPDIYEYHPLVERSLGRGTPYMWSDVILKEEHEIIFADPYFNSDFIKRKNHVLEAWCEELGIDYDISMKPQLYLGKHHIDDAKKFKKENGDFIAVQFSSGQSPLNFNPNQPFMWTGFQREYPFDKAQELINLIKEKYPDLKIVLFGLPNEFTSQLEGVIKLTAPYLSYAGLLTESKGFIGINSCLTHFAGALEKKGIVLWGGTSAKQWGYDFHININHECSRNDLFCSRPYLRELGDFVGNGQKWTCPNPTCMNIPPQEILTELTNLIERKP